MATPTDAAPDEQDGRGRARKVARAAGFALYCLVAIELLLWIASAAIPSVGVRLSNRRAEPPFLPHETLGRIGNPAWAEHDPRGFRNEAALDAARIVTLGDSQTWGINAPREQTWPKQLQALLDVPVYNMAVGATGPAYYHHLVEDALELSPEWVLTGFYFGNDLWNAENDYYRRDLPGLDPTEPRDPRRAREVDERARFITEEYVEAAELLQFQPPRRPTRDREESGAGSGGVDLLREHSKLWGAVRAIKIGLESRLETETTGSGERFSRRHWEQLVETARRDPGVVVYEDGSTRTTLHPGHRIHGVDVNDDPLLEEGLEISLELLRRIDRRVRARGARHMVVLIPSKEYVYAPFVEVEDGEAKSILSRLIAGEDEIRERTKRHLDADGMEYVDTTPALRRAVERGVQIYPYSTQSHPNAKGYGTIAESVATALRRHGL